MLETTENPKCFENCPVISLFKKGKRDDCNNYRGISLTDTGYKIYAKLINTQLQTICEALVSEEWCEFRKYRS